MAAQIALPPARSKPDTEEIARQYRGIRESVPNQAAQSSEERPPGQRGHGRLAANCSSKSAAFRHLEVSLFESFCY